MKIGQEQGDYTMIDIGPYDEWAIEYGYTFAKKREDLKPILDRVAEPELQYGTDEDTYGPDPRARRYDFGKDPLTYGRSQMRLVKYHRERLMEHFVKDGESWSKARRGYETTLALQTRAVSMMANWIGGAYVHRDKKGDSNARRPVVVVPAEKQRAALEFIIENTFRDKAYGLTPDLMTRLGSDKWLDDFYSAFEESTFPVHDRIMGIQSSVMTMVLNPNTLGRVYDNEFMTPPDEDMFSMPELLDKLHSAIWAELENVGDEHFTVRKPMISSLRRNLQREHLDRLIDLTLANPWFGAARKPVSNLALMNLNRARTEIAKVQNNSDTKMDAYTKAHLRQSSGWTRHWRRNSSTIRATYHVARRLLAEASLGVPFQSDYPRAKAGFDCVVLILTVHE